MVLAAILKNHAAIKKPRLVGMAFLRSDYNDS